MLGIPGHLIVTSGNIRGRTTPDDFLLGLFPHLLRSLAVAFADPYAALSSACLPFSQLFSLFLLPWNMAFPSLSCPAYSLPSSTGFVGLAPLATYVPAQQPIALLFGGQPTALLGLCLFVGHEGRQSRPVSFPTPFLSSVLDPIPSLESLASVTATWDTEMKVR